MTIRKKMLNLVSLLWISGIGLISSWEGNNMIYFLISIGLVALITLYSYYISGAKDKIIVDKTGLVCNNGKDKLDWNEIRYIKMEKYGERLGARDRHINYNLIITKTNGKIVKIENIEFFLYFPFLIKTIIKKYSKTDYFK
jgi:hypothetical protein